LEAWFWIIRTSISSSAEWFFTQDMAMGHTALPSVVTIVERASGVLACALAASHKPAAGGMRV
jgi:hypothetical protein